MDCLFDPGIAKCPKFIHGILKTTDPQGAPGESFPSLILCDGSQATPYNRVIFSQCPLIARGLIQHQLIAHGELLFSIEGLLKLALILIGVTGRKPKDILCRKSSQACRLIDLDCDERDKPTLF